MLPQLLVRSKPTASSPARLLLLLEPALHGGFHTHLFIGQASRTMRQAKNLTLVHYTTRPGTQMHQEPLASGFLIATAQPDLLLWLAESLACANLVQ